MNSKIVANNKKEMIKLSLSPKRAKAVLRIVKFKDHDFDIVYVPSLNLSGYGKDTQEAMDMLTNVVLDDFFENITKLSESKVFNEFRKLGWSQNKILRKQFNISSAYVDKEGILKNFHLPEETVINEEFIAV